MNPELISLIKDFGIPYGMALFLIVLIYRGIKNHVWPFAKTLVQDAVNHWKESVNEVNEARRKSFDELSTLAHQSAETNGEILKSLTILTGEVQEMRRESQAERRASPSRRGRQGE